MQIFVWTPIRAMLVIPSCLQTCQSGHPAGYITGSRLQSSHHSAIHQGSSGAHPAQGARARADRLSSAAPPQHQRSLSAVSLASETEWNRKFGETFIHRRNVLNESQFHSSPRPSPKDLNHSRTGYSIPPANSARVPTQDEIQLYDPSLAINLML